MFTIVIKLCKDSVESNISPTAGICTRISRPLYIATRTKCLSNNLQIVNGILININGEMSILIPLVTKYTVPVFVQMLKPEIDLL